MWHRENFSVFSVRSLIKTNTTFKRTFKGATLRKVFANLSLKASNMGENILSFFSFANFFKQMCAKTHSHIFRVHPSVISRRAPMHLPG